MQHIDKNPSVLEARDLLDRLEREHVTVSNRLTAAKAGSEWGRSVGEEQPVNPIDRMRRVLSDEQEKVRPVEIDRLAARENDLAAAKRMAAEEVERARRAASTALVISNGPERRKLRRASLKALAGLAAALNDEDAFSQKLFAAGADVSWPVTLGTTSLRADELRGIADSRARDVEREELQASVDDGKKQRVRLLMEVLVNGTRYYTDSVVDLPRRDARLLILDRKAEVSDAPVNVRTRWEALNMRAFFPTVWS